MQSPEYPDLPFVRPRSWTAGRTRPVQLIVVHYTAGSEGPRSAEDGAAYDARRTDGTSCHYMVDSDSVIQEVLTSDRSHSAFSEGNNRGIHYEICGTAQTRAQWLDAVSDATITNAARQMARDCRKYGIPVRWLTVDEMRAGAKGICGHGDVTMAWHQGDHMDPGPGFPRDVLLARINQFMNPGPVTAALKEDEDDMMMFHAIDTKATGSTSDDVALFAVIQGGSIRVAYAPNQGTMNKIAGHPKGSGDSVRMTPAEWNGLMKLYGVGDWMLRDDGSLISPA